MASQDHPTPTPDSAAGPGIPEGGRPLGFWLKTVDRLIAREFLAAFDDLDVTRREWRLLNLIGRDVRDERLTAKLTRRPGIVAPLVERGWVSGEAGDWRLTDDGREALEGLGERVGGIRSRIADAVPAADYETTVTTLEAIARELGWNEADAETRPGRRFGRGARGHRGHGAPGAPRWPGARPGRPGGFGHPGARDEVHVHVHVHGDRGRGRASDRHGDPHHSGHGRGRCGHDHR